MMYVALACLLISQAFALGGMPGGWSSADGNDETVQSVVKFVEWQLNAQSNSIFRNKITNVINVQKQVVAGMNYKVDFEFSQTGCSKLSMITLESCLPSGDQVQDCTATVYVHFSGQKTLSNFKCQAQKMDSKRAGGISEVKGDLTQYNDLAFRALSMANRDLENVKIVSVKQQVVSGIRYVMKVEATEGGEMRHCTLDLWSQPWVAESLKVTQFVCDEDKAKRSLGAGLAGGISPFSGTDDDLETLVSKGLMDMNSNLATKDVKILGATEQVVAGMKYVVDLETQDGQHCHMTIIEQVWMSDSIHASMDCGKHHDDKRGNLGGVSDIKGDLSEYLDIANRVVSTANADLSDCKVVKASRQTVAGLRYRMTIEANQNGEMQTCEIDAWVKPWIPSHFVVNKFECSKKMKRALGGGRFGGLKEVTGNLSQYKDLFFRASSLQMANSLVENVKVTKVFQQVVSGVRYVMKVDATVDGEDKHCDLDLWDQPWIQDGLKVTQFTCA